MDEFDRFDHESHMRRALDLAREANRRDDDPFGSVLVSDDEVIMTAGNRVHTAGDLRRHPELDLAYRAGGQLSASERRETVMYTSAEPCPMCAGGIRIAGLGRMVYSVGSDVLAGMRNTEPTVRSAEILAGVTTVDGPILAEDGRELYEAWAAR